MDRIPAGVWIFHAIWITTLAVAIAARFLGANPNKYIFLQTVVFALTLVALVVYTHFTRKMQQAMVKQTTVNVLPCFIAYVGRTSMKNELDKTVKCFELENIGNGIALNVTVDTIDIELGAVIDFIPAPHVVFDPILSIRPTETVVVPHSSYINYEATDNRVAAFDWMSNLAPARAEKNYELKIHFMDILGNHYLQVIHAGKSGVWPDIVTPDDGKYRQPSISLITPFSESPLREITAKERRQLWGPRRP